MPDHPLTLDARDRLLDAVARGLRKLDAQATQDQPALWRVEVALLDDEAGVLRVGNLASVLGWIVDQQHQCDAARDTRLRDARDAHVSVFEGRCVECGGDHRDPCPECDRNPGDGAGDGCDTCDRLARESRGEDDSDEDDDASGGRRGTVEHTVNGLSRGRIVALLESASIQCYDHESDAELREALVENVLDGTIEESSLHDDGGGA